MVVDQSLEVSFLVKKQTERERENKDTKQKKTKERKRNALGMEN